MSIDVTLVYDVEGWAWHRRAMDLVEFAPPEYDILAVSQAQFRGGNIRRLNRHLMFFAWIECPLDIASRAVTLLANPCIQFEPWKDHNPEGKNWIQAGSTRNRSRTNAKARLKKFKKVICLTPELDRIAKTFGANSVCCPTGINHEVFTPLQQLGRQPKLQVAWCGQVHDDKPYNQKGYRWICEPLQELCKDFCDFQINKRNYTNALHRSEMVNWYNAADVFLCTSIHEGTPTTAMEAMMCGRPVVTTHVGDMPNIIKQGQNGYITGSYTDQESANEIIKNTYSYLLKLHEDRKLLCEMGQKARQIMVETRNWKTLARTWLEAITN